MIERAAPKERIISALASLFRACGRALLGEGQRSRTHAESEALMRTHLAFMKAERSANAQEHRRLQGEERKIGYKFSIFDSLEKRRNILSWIKRGCQRRVWDLEPDGFTLFMINLSREERAAVRGHMARMHKLWRRQQPWAKDNPSPR